MDLNALRVFVLVVEAGGITEGARRAALPKSTVSRQARDLEISIGERLLERRGRGLAPTAAGRRLYETARMAITALEALRQDRSAAPVAGRVRVAAPAMLARGLLQDLLTDFIGQHPAIALEVMVSDRFVAAEAADADVAFCVGITPGAGKPPVSLGQVEARLYAAPGLIGEAGTPHTPADLMRLPILAQGCAPGGQSGWTIEDPRGTRHDIAFTPRLVTSDPDLLLAAALAGRGVCRVATFIAEAHLRTGRLIPVLDGWVAERHAVAITTVRRAHDPAVSCFATEAAVMLRERLATR